MNELVANPGLLHFLSFLFAHLLADYPLQGSFLAVHKGENMLILGVHAGLWTGCIATVGYLVGYNVDLIDILLLMSVHMGADYMKANARGWYGYMDELREGLLLDQLIHVAQILLFMLMN